MSRYGSAGLTITMSAPSSKSSAISRIASSPLGGSIWYERRSPNCGADSAASRNAEQNNRGDTGGVSFAGSAHNVVHRHLRHSRHRGDRFGDVAAGTDEV